VFPKFFSGTYRLQIYTGATPGIGTWSWLIDSVVVTTVSFAAANIQFPAVTIFGGPRTVRLEAPAAGVFQSYDDTIYIVQTA